MKWALKFDAFESSVVQNKNFVYTAVSYSVILAIFTNLAGFQSPLIGLVASVIYFAINAIFLGNAFFEKENALFRFLFGFLLLVLFLGFVGWLVMIIYSLEVSLFTLVLFVTSTLCSLLNRRVKHENASKN